ncbi:hypothetical protein BSR29_06845 [Boudabousia liubingyangii]|uniref:Phosphatidic acid phosphatase type 2/haloperoxidase domain-containing protein n=1 Tax=Boudabousia liubingyangii TaxID=1921764 RepID=A0A1Q5PJZ9_9ACTO|nr:phosphatase PAP2 family protein [Boudabousia liubingyangii]OKL46543.1 hypothetical protein BSR29_06845 [Boudabousia liubingyangii]
MDSVNRGRHSSSAFAAEDDEWYPKQESTPRPAGPHRAVRKRDYLLRFSKAFMGFLGAVLLWYTAVLTRPGQILDAFTMEAAGVWDGQLWGVDEVVLFLVSTKMIVIVAILVVIITFWRQRWELGLRALAVMLLTIGVVQLLKRYVFWRPAFGVTYALPNSYPSGHTAAAAAVSVAAVMVVARRWRSFTAFLGAIWVSTVGTATVINAWHRPSDVLGAVMIAGAFGLLFTPLEASRGRTWGDLRMQHFLGVVGWAFFILGLVSSVLVAMMIWNQFGFSGSEVLVAQIFRQAHAGGAVVHLAHLAGLSLILGLVSLVLRSVDKLVQ